MKTLFICAEENIESHVGEEYDEILYVTSKIDAANFKQWTERIRDAIRLVNSQVTEVDTDKRVGVYFHCPSPYMASVVDFQVIMKETEGIDLVLPQIDEKTFYKNDIINQEPDVVIPRVALDENN